MRNWNTLAFIGLLVVTPCLAEEPDLAYAIRELKAWRSKFATIRVEYAWQNREQLLARFPELAKNNKWDDFLCHKLWIWTDSEKLRFESNKHESGFVVRRSHKGTDGELLWGAMSKRGIEESLRWENMRIAPRGPKSPQSVGLDVAPVRNLWMSGTALWLGDYLEKYPPSSVQVAEYAGCRCLKLVYGKNALFLDLDHNCLPRLFEPPPYDGRFAGFRYENEEFLRLPEGIWFPQRGTYRQVLENTDYTWKLTKVVLNEHFSKDLFRPPEPTPGTLLIDETPGRRFATKFYGKRTHKTSEQTKQEPPPRRPDVPVAAIPESPRWIWWTTSFGALFLATIAVWLNSRRK